MFNSHKCNNWISRFRNSILLYCIFFNFLLIKLCNQLIWNYDPRSWRRDFFTYVRRIFWISMLDGLFSKRCLQKQSKQKTKLWFNCSSFFGYIFLMDLFPFFKRGCNDNPKFKIFNSNEYCICLNREYNSLIYSFSSIKQK